MVIENCSKSSGPNSVIQNDDAKNAKTRVVDLRYTVCLINNLFSSFVGSFDSLEVKL